MIFLVLSFLTSLSGSLQVPEIISTLRQAGKSSARSNDSASASRQPGASDSSLSSSSLPSATSGEPTLVVSPTAFAKKFEVLFCGRVSVAHKKAPPALIDECIEKFSRLTGSRAPAAGGGVVGGLKRALAFQTNGLGSVTVGNGGAGSPTDGKRPALFKRDPGFPVQTVDENGPPPEVCHSNPTDPKTVSPGVQPTSLRDNRTMLFTVTLQPRPPRTAGSVSDPLETWRGGHLSTPRGTDISNIVCQVAAGLCGSVSAPPLVVWVRCRCRCSVTGPPLVQDQLTNCDVNHSATVVSCDGCSFLSVNDPDDSASRWIP